MVRWIVRWRWAAILTVASFVLVAGCATRPTQLSKGEAEPPRAGQSSAIPTGPLWQEVRSPEVDPELARFSRAVGRLVDRMMPALVQVRVRGAQEVLRDAPDDENHRGPRRAMGSGFIINSEGFIVTNHHVIARGEGIEVRLADGRRFRARVVGKDPRTDLALLKIDEAKELSVAPLGNSDALHVGELVVALGHPFGLDKTVSLGIVSRKGPHTRGMGLGFDFIQTDAAVNPGNSGGPLVNMAGEVVGVNSMASQGGSIGFAIPINLVKGLLPQLAEKGMVTWGWLGVGVDEVNEDNATTVGLKEPRGVLIRQVMPGQPAEKGGIKPKDVVLAVAGKPVNTPRDLQREVSMLPVGKEIPIRVFREGKEIDVTVLVGAWEPPKEERKEK